MKTWKTISSKKVYECGRFSIFEDNVVRPDGSRTKYTFQKKQASVVVIPFDGNKIYLVNQFRYPIKRRSWELPAGRAENKNYLLQAKKELAEETGIRAASWKYLAQFAPSNGSSNHIGKIYLAQNLKFGKSNLEPGEADMFMQGFTLKEIDKMIKAGKIWDGWAIVPLYFFKLFFHL